MNIDILKNDALQLPIANTGECSTTIKRAIEKYINVLKEYNCDTSIMDKVRSFNKDLGRMYRAYYLGRHSTAYQKFLAAISQCTSSLFKCSIPNDVYYRARINTENIDFSNDEMFYVPTKNRGKIGTQRYSFPGLPCLYMGASSYVCWIETNRPQINQFQVASIRKINPDKDIKVIDLSLHPMRVYNILSKNENAVSLDEYLLLWPIIAACSIVVKNEKDLFKPEYIFPQFMLEYVLEKKNQVKGIKYFSMKIANISKKQYENDEKLFVNYVFPIRGKGETSEKKEYLDTEFKIQSNLSGRELEILSDLIRQESIHWEEFINKDESDSLEDVELYSSNGASFPYNKTVFRRIENLLSAQNMARYVETGQKVIKPINSNEIKRIVDKYF